MWHRWFVTGHVGFQLHQHCSPDEREVLASHDATNISTYHNIMTSGRSTDWFCIDAITGANPPPDFISFPIPIQAKWEQGFNASRVTRRKGGKHKRERRNRFGKLQVRPCDKSTEPEDPVGRFRSITRFLGRTKVSFDKSFLCVRFNLPSREESERNRIRRWSWFYDVIKPEINFENHTSKSNLSEMINRYTI